ncbi:retrovirus-related pol polyprotein from transposon tnt 1-94 [Cucumis melo var. makuwa]|uniref:Retrovirus-related pol polyprotein from transposon tnt 1-94 n=1 Tax=Cucumis melo var. makuwa TaxID=1194695 RepID=A0A5A7T2F5_CUCMM|nr:retrovirus-related pol polyprotein from transposon tnt 1-94 [Cucumis melo var. makuwa]TYK30985.1 retrovirus-related pol polyprotein from transposon tnt 1-94 [Cucumis melo var. makuwa]
MDIKAQQRYSLSRHNMELLCLRNNVLRHLKRFSVYSYRGAVVWRSIKQRCIADSTMEAEYVVACEAAKEVVWLRKFLIDLEVVPNMSKPITFYIDNSGAVTNSREPRSHKCGNHIEHKYHIIREIVHRGDVIVTQIASTYNVDDLFTKLFMAKVFYGHLEGLSLPDMPHLI